MRMSGSVHKLSFTTPCWRAWQCGHLHASSWASCKGSHGTVRLHPPKGPAHPARGPAPPPPPRGAGPAPPWCRTGNTRPGCSCAAGAPAAAATRCPRPGPAPPGRSRTGCARADRPCGSSPSAGFPQSPLPANSAPGTCRGGRGLFLQVPGIAPSPFLEFSVSLASSERDRALGSLILVSCRDAGPGVLQVINKCPSPKSGRCPGCESRGHGLSDSELGRKAWGLPVPGFPHLTVWIRVRPPGTL